MSSAAEFSEVDIALEQLRRAVSRECAERQQRGPMITMFMGFTPVQILHLAAFFEEKTGRDAQTISSGDVMKTRPENG